MPQTCRRRGARIAVSNPAIRTSSALAVLSIWGCAAQLAIAANGTDTWVGNTSAQWSNGANWTGANTPPSTGDSLSFGAAGSAGTTLTDNLMTYPNYTLAGLTFTGLSNYTINPSVTGAYSNTTANGFVLGGTLSSAGTQVINDNIRISVSQSILVTSGQLTLGGAFTSPNSSSIPYNVNSGNEPGTLVLSGGADNSGAYLSITAGTLVLSKTGTGASGIHALAGLTGVGANATVKFAGTGSFQLYRHVNLSNMLGKLDLAGTSQFIRGISGTSSSAQIYNSTASTASTLTIGFDNANGNITVSGSGTAVSSSFAGVIKDNTGTGGTLALYVQGSGANALSGTGASNTFTLTGQNTYSGSTTIAYGGAASTTQGYGNATLVLANSTNNSNILSSTNAVVMGGALDTNTGVNTLQLGNTNSATAFTQSLSSLTSTGLATNRVVNGNSNAAGSILVINPSGTVTFGGILGGGPSGTATENNLALSLGSGTLALAGANTHTGATSVNAGTLNLSNQNALQNSTLTMNGGAVVFDSSVAGNAYTLGGLSATNAVANNIVLRNNAGSPAPIALSVGNNGANTTYAAALSGTGSLTKIGSGTLTLSGTNLYTGATSVSAGKLLFNGNSSGATGAVGVASAATLGGTGTIGGVVTMAGGSNLAPGDSTVTNTAGKLTVASLNLNGTTNHTRMEIGGTTLGSGYDNITVTTSGALTWGGVLDVTALSGFNQNTATGTFDLFAFTGSATGNFDNVNVFGTALTRSGAVWSSTYYSFSQATGDLTVTPEPAGLSLLGMGAMGLLARRRRRGSSTAVIH